MARVVMPGLAHHITQRGIRRSNVFANDADRQMYLGLFVENCRRYSLRILAYCLMTNHVHFVAVPENKQSIWRTFHRCHSTYAMNFNLRYGFSGHLWQGRPYSSVLDEAHQWAAVRYVERNPVRAHMVTNADDYAWSSAQAHCGIRNDPLLDPDWPPAGCIQDWREWLRGNDPVHMARDIRENTFSGRPCGDDEFVRAVGYQLNRDLKKKKPGPKPQRLPDDQDRVLRTTDEIHK